MKLAQTCPRPMASVALAALMAGWITPAYAQTAPAPAAEAEQGVGAASGEIIVTAERRSQSLQHVPLAVTAVANAELQSRSITSLIDLQRVSPSLTMVNAGGVNVSPFLRGIGSATAGAGLFSSVSTYVDGVYQGDVFHGAVDINLADQVQILSGPQGTLYGRNATGGAILISNPVGEPGSALAFKGRLSYGNYNALNAFATVKGSLSDKVGFYIGASHNRHDGFTPNLNPSNSPFYNGELNDLNTYQVQGALKFAPTPALSIVLRGAYSRKFDREGQNLQATGLDIRPAALGGLNGSQAYYAGTLQALGIPPATAFGIASGMTFSPRYNTSFDILKNGFENGILSGAHKQGGFIYQRNTSASLDISYDFGPATLRSLTAYKDSLANSTAELVKASPASLPPGFTGIGFSGYDPEKSYQQEFQITSNSGPIQYTAGLVYYRIKGRSDTTGDFPVGVSVILSDNNFIITSKAAYAQVTVPIVGKLSVTGGLRYTKETYKLEDLFNPANPASLPGVTNFGTKQSDSSKLTYTARLQYDNGPLLLYASVISGFKGATLTPVSPFNPAVDPETITSYEAGFKWSPTPQIRLNGDAFHYDYNHIQLAYTDTATGGNITINGPGSKMTGAELSVAAKPTDWLSLQAGGFVLKARYAGDVIGNAGTIPVLLIKGNRLAGAPKSGISAGAAVDYPIGDKAIVGSLNLVHSSGYYFESQSLVGTGGTTPDPYTTVDGSLGIAFADRRIKLSVFGNNIFGEKYYISGTTGSGLLRTVSAAAPSTYGIALDVKY